MDYGSLFTAQITDIFRIGLLAGLIYTAERTRAQTGILVPLLAGIVFIAFIIPTTMPKPGIDLTAAIAMGLVSNAAILAVLMLVWSTVKSKL